MSTLAIIKPIDPERCLQHKLAEGRRAVDSTCGRRAGALDDGGVGGGVDGLGEVLRVRDRRDGVVGEVSKYQRRELPQVST